MRFVRIYDCYSEFPIYPKSEKRDDADYASRIAGVKIDKEPGVKRILVLGDSISYGAAIMKKETFPVRLEELLNNDGRDEEFEVINASYPGIDMVAKLAIFNGRAPFSLRKQGFVGQPISRIWLF